ncbi:hypothetical protein PQR72_10465 [Paraburkholderia madseniana]|jgi:hypothetical protein|uniref:T6SS effector BTH_I2691 family protein n=1 Tax=Paraburkholderia madseniana TaxID=2599607 RepID=UPI0015C5385A|nr:T6SS effector BTH_I2691 family protein [Paraburkholderia madseniana]NPT63266.1 hypothetical protein [Paraburkholderia madseniana]
MATSNQKCANCEKTGLPILPVRYTVLPKTAKAKIPAGVTGDRVTSIKLQEHQYGVRTLRQGWLYLFYEVGARGKNYWEAYNVTEDGRLWKQLLPLPSTPVTDPACAQCAIAVPMDLIAIERPEKCTGRVFVAFSELAWHQQTFNKYQADETLRMKRMQWIEPSKWIGSGKDAHGHAVVATASAIDQVVEYMPGFDARTLSVLDDKQRFSDDKGGYKEDLLKQEVSRYPLYIRQASPASASQSLVKLMEHIGTISQDGSAADAAGGPANHYPPMMLALWDAVGNTHELNGYRNDPVSWMDRYASKQELGMQVMALHHIDEAQRIVYARQKDEVVSQEGLAKQAHDMSPLGQPGAQSALSAQRAKALAGADPSRAAQINAYYDDMDWMAANNIPGSYQTRIIQAGQLSSAGSANSPAAYVGNYRDSIMNDARAYAKAQPGFHDRDVKDMQTFGWSDYEQRLKRKDIELFRDKYTSLQQAIYQLQETRSNDVGQWLKAELLFDTLEDYHCDELNDSLDFEIVVSLAIDGLASTPKGQAIVDDLITRWNPVEKSSLVWRAVAMNHPAGREELAKMLASAQENKEKPLESGGADIVVTAAGYAKKLADKYKQYAKLALEKDPKKLSWLGEKYKAEGRDTLVMNIGDRIFEKFRINQVGDFVGEKIVQTVLLQRAGIPVEDALSIVRKEAQFAKKSRLEILERMRTAKTILTGTAATGDGATDELYKVWNTLKEEKNETALKELRMGRIAAFAAICELVNFWHLLAGAKDDETTSKLVKSGASLCAAIITITMTPYYGTLKNSARALSWKLVGGFLSGVGVFAAAWLDACNVKKNVASGKYDIAVFMIIKTAVGGLSGFAILIDAISSAAPIFKRLGARSGNRVVVLAVETVTKKLAAMAALKVVGALLSFEATLLLTALQFLADHLMPDSLEAWCSRCAFGTGREATLRIKDHDVPRYTDMPQQETEFDKVISEGI